MKIGFIGLGIMGTPMAKNLITKQNEKVYIYDLDKEKVNELVKEGGIACQNISEVAQNAQIIFSMVPTGKHVEAVYNELLPHITPEHICIDMSTIDPETSIKVAQKVAQKGSVMLDSPVVKSKAAAEKGILGIYVSGNKEIYEKVKPLLLLMGENTIYLGENGKALAMKLCHNMLVGIIQNGVNEVICLAEKIGIDIDDFVRAISYGGGQNFYLDTKGKAIKERNFETAFSIQNMNKDVDLACELKDSYQLTLPNFDLVQHVYHEAIENNLGNLDFSASFKVVKKEK